MFISGNALGFTLGLAATFLGIGVIVNVLIAYVVGLVLAERRANKQDSQNTF